MLTEGLDVLHDPYADLGANAGAAQSVNPIRFEEAGAVCKAIRSLDSSSSLDEFYRNRVELSDGVVGTFYKLGRSIADTLEKAEAKFVQDVWKWDKTLKSELSFEDLRNATAELIYSVINQGVRLMAEGMGFSPEESQELNRVRAACYPHLGYLVTRSFEYSIAAGRTGVPDVDKNDYEDGLISCHLTLATDLVLVAADNDFRRCLNRALSALQETCGFQASCRILNLADFATEIGV